MKKIIEFFSTYTIPILSFGLFCTLIFAHVNNHIQSNEKREMIVEMMRSDSLMQGDYRFCVSSTLQTETDAELIKKTCLDFLIAKHDSEKLMVEMLK